MRSNSLLSKKIVKRTAHLLSFKRWKYKPERK